MNKHFSSYCKVALAAAGLSLAAAPAFADTASSKGGIKVKSADGLFEGAIIGRLMADFSVFDNDVAENQSGAEFRRLRLGSKGKIYGYGYKISVDFADDQVDVKDAYLKFDLLGGALTVGQFRQYFSLQENTSSNHIGLMERSYLTQFAPSRQIGVGYWRNHGIFGAGLSAYNVDDNDNDEEEGVGASLRLVAGPTFGSQVQTHFGIAAVSEGGIQGRNRVRVRPAGHLSDASRTTLIDINNGNRSKSTRYGLEAAVVAGPVSLQMELVDGSYEDDAQDEDIKAWYAQVGWFITGETRPYKVGAGKFGGIKPKRAGGAWEVVARLDYAENDTTELEIEGQTIGVNWYVNPQIRLMLNYIAADVAEGADEPNAVTGRLQFNF